MPSASETPVRALTVTEAEHIELLPVTTPSGPLAADEVFGRTVCSLVSPGTEIGGAFRPSPTRPARYPTTPGYAAVFEVLETGDAVTSAQVGDRVFTHGGHRTHQRKREADVVRLPDGLDPFDAVYARLMAVPMTSLVTTAARPGDRVGVSGLGPIGYFAAAVFAASGYQVTAWDPRTDRHANLPASVVALDAAPQPGARAQYGSTDGFDLVLECSGHDGAALDCVRAVRSLGEVVFVGTPWRRRTDATAHELIDEIFHRYAVVRSGWEWQIPAQETPFVGPSAEKNLHRALSWLADGSVAVRHLADRHRPEDAQAVYTALADGTTPRLTALFDWS